LNQVNGFLTREVGKFVLTGKSNPLVLHELIDSMTESTHHHRNLCTSFSEALDAFKRRSWEEAIKKFKDLIKRFGQDGPSAFYIKLCEQYREKPPEKKWNEIVCIGTK
jgi:adenylate cyclase